MFREPIAPTKTDLSAVCAIAMGSLCPHIQYINLCRVDSTASTLWTGPFLIAGVPG